MPSDAPGLFPMPPAEAWCGWVRLPGKRWTPVVYGPTWECCWDRLLAYLDELAAPHTEAIVKRAGRRP